MSPAVQIAVLVRPTKRTALWLLLPAFLLAGPRGQALAQVPDVTQQQALATVAQYARDMMIVLPCFYMIAPVASWEKAYGEPELNETTEIYGNNGASPAQIEALRKAYQESLRLNLVADIRVVARACNDDKIFDSIYRLAGPALPLMLRPPFPKRP